VAFQGNLLHGVMPTAVSGASAEEEEDFRLTLLVNWWTVVPEAPCCSPLPDDMLAVLAHADVPTAAPGSSMYTSNCRCL